MISVPWCLMPASLLDKLTLNQIIQVNGGLDCKDLTEKPPGGPMPQASEQPSSEPDNLESVASLKTMIKLCSIHAKLMKLKSPRGLSSKIMDRHSLLNLKESQGLMIRSWPPFRPFKCRPHGLCSDMTETRGRCWR